MTQAPTITRLGVYGAWWAARAVAGLMALVAAGFAGAGGGPEGVALVVNLNRPDSKEVANHYVRLRNLPAMNVIAIDYQGNPEKTNGDTFREQILQPVLAEIDRRGLAVQIDTIAYSCGFPWQIDLRADFPQAARPPRQLMPVASLTGATYFWQAILAKQPAYLGNDANYYLSGPAGANLSQCQQLGETPTRAFRGRYRWLRGGVRQDRAPQARRYLMSTVLGVTTGRGNSVQEVIALLERAVQAEVTPPQGVFCFVKNSNVRSKTRHGCYPAAAAVLTGLGARASVEEGTLPRPGTRVAGMTLGAAVLPLEQAGLVIEPGAICEHLTSTGGNFALDAKQTPLSELIRRGATGASGTVEEPYAVQAKFPLPSIQIHYRRGSSLAEAYYQSVASPYQLLIVGDPLCQPWADRPAMRLEGWPEDRQTTLNRPTDIASAAPAKDNASNLTSLKLDFSLPVTSSDSAKGGPQLKPLRSLAPATAPTDQTALAPAESPAEPPLPPGAFRLTPHVGANLSGPAPTTAYWELFVDGRLRLRLPTGRGAVVDPAEFGAGWHELRCVGVGTGPLEPQRLRVAEIETPSNLQRAAQPADPEPLAGAESKPDQSGKRGDLEKPGDGGKAVARDVKLAVKPSDWRLNDVVPVEVSAQGADSIVLLHNAREVGRITGPVGVIRVMAAELGAGPVRLQAQAEPGTVRSATHWITID
ncbi:hypothetical protein [Botrimarina hoheduenensis]|uniref:TIGR03790 family protein n=1 Tax=Botrimarina hoheduenensis TaxID=2528000 RepID=A0A5C5W9G3_9BACT|nr:hypothetical protein [Botrimarina hoheduenensis]TWT46651.1 hypothetical protein Pla111_17520 [Botrimarina hoheduenensis]